MKNSVTLIVKPTHACNLNCYYCYEKENRSLIKSTMSLEDVEKIASLFKDSLREWIWHGGEPLMMGVDFFYAADKIIKSIIPNVKINMQTNGTLINEGVIELFKKDNIRPGLSFDGINNNLTRKSTPALMNSFNLLEKNNINFGAILLITGDNVNDLASEYEYCKRLGIKIQMNVVFEVKKNPGAIAVENKKMIDGISKFFDYWMMDTYNPSPSGFCSHYVELLLGNSKKKFCYEGHCVGRWFSIHGNGDIFPCGRDWTDEYCFTNLHVINDIEEIYGCESYKNYYDKATKLHQKCEQSNCCFYDVCEAGCYGNACTHNSSLVEVDPSHCNVLKGVFTHVYNRIKNIDKNIEYNPYFIKSLGNYYYQDKSE